METLKECDYCHNLILESMYMEFDGLCMWCAERKEYRDAKEVFLKEIEKVLMPIIKWIDKVVNFKKK